jgi:hypothetical protein
MPEEMHEEPGWPTPEEEAILDRVNDRIGAQIAAGEIELTSDEELEENARSAERYRLQREADRERSRP